MITKKIQIYINRLIIADVQPYLTTLFQYYKGNDVVLNYDITPVNIYGYKSTLVQINSGGTGYVLRGAESLVPASPDHDIVMFVFDLNEWKSPWYWPFPLRWDCPRSDCSLVNGKPFINFGFYDKDPQGTQLTLLHEPMHALAKIFGCIDQMDTYYKNNISQYKDDDSNFSTQWKIFQPYLNEKNMQSKVKLTRNLDNGIETLGTLVAQNNGATFSCSTLELPWKDNHQDISCIPKGTYQCSVQPFHNTHMYELQGTAPRTGIFIHPGNYFTDVLGCILLGVKPSDINHDGQIDVTSSVNTINSFMQFMGNNPFTLTIQ